jgi:hypothetical protein
VSSYLGGDMVAVERSDLAASGVGTIEAPSPSV